MSEHPDPPIVRGDTHSGRDADIIPNGNKIGFAAEIPSIQYFASGPDDKTLFF